MTTAFVTACGFVDAGGIGGSHAPRSCVRSVSAAAPALRWSEIADRPYDHFGRLDLLSQYSLAAVEMLGIREGSMGCDAAVVLATRFGCLSADIAFYRSVLGPTGPSPALFSYTLPSMAVGEIAIRHGITGHSLCLMGGSDSASLALWEGLNLIADGEANRCVCVTCDAVRADSVEAAALLRGEGQKAECCAYAFLLESADLIAANARPTAATARIDRAPSAAALAVAGEYNALRRLRDFLTADAGEPCVRLPAPQCFNASGTIVVQRRPGPALAPETRERS